MLMYWLSEGPWGAWSKLNECDVMSHALDMPRVQFSSLAKCQTRVEWLSNFLCGTNSFLCL